MNDVQVLEIVMGALGISAKLAGPILLASLGMGVIISILQVVTQIQEATLTFVPKLVGIALIVLFAGNWMMRELVAWVVGLWSSIPSIG